MIRVRAIAKGYYNGKIRVEDEVFMVEDNHRKATWFIPMDEVKSHNAPAAEIAEPATPEEAMKLTNAQIKDFMDAEDVKYDPTATKKELISTWFRERGKREDAANLV